MTRLVASEYQSDPEWLPRASHETGLGRTQLSQIVSEASERIAKSLRLPQAPLTIFGDELQVSGIAGMVRLSPSVELEVVPKFLSSDDPTWREDFFFLAGLSTQSTLLPSEKIHSTGGARNNLASLIALFMVNEFARLQRRPLRTYRTLEWRNWSAEGELDPADLVVPEAEGLHQRGILLTKQNHYNAVISSALTTLLPLLSDPNLRSQLLRIRSQLFMPRVGLNLTQRKLIPSRHSHWSQLYELSLQVNRGLGMSLDTGRLTAPGFVIDTWRTWEQLIRRSLSIQFSNRAVYHPSFQLGIDTWGNPVMVTPDVSIGLETQKILLADAKYKTRFLDVSKVSRADVYESLAFLEASKASRLFLIYPMAQRTTSDEHPTGSVRVFERISIGHKKIVAFEVSVRHIGKRFGLRTFARGLSEALLQND